VNCNFVDEEEEFHAGRFSTGRLFNKMCKFEGIIYQQEIKHVGITESAKPKTK
jgi:hypothetical protein